jgi:hypothetical protein
MLKTKQAAFALFERALETTRSQHVLRCESELAYLVVVLSSNVQVADPIRNGAVCLVPFR